MSYAAPVAKAMKPFNDVTYLAIPAWPKTQILPPAWLGVEVGLLAGHLYFDYAHYKFLLTWLGISDPVIPTSTVEESPSAVTSGFSIEQPLGFLQEWMTFRRHSADILHTPMGFVCQRKLLSEDHFFFREQQYAFAEEPKIAKIDEDGEEEEMDSVCDALASTKLG